MNRIERYLANLADAGAASDLRMAVRDLYQNQSLAAAGAAIKTTDSPTVKYANAIKALVDGKLVTKAAGDFPDLAGPSVDAGASQAWIFTINAAAELGTYPGTPGVGVAQIKLPSLPTTVVPVAVLYLTNGTASAFTPATTALDVASLVPVYVDLTGPFYPIP